MVRMDSLASIRDSIKEPQAIEVNNIEKEEHPLWNYKKGGIKYVNGKWFFENKLVGGLVDIGHCIYVDENASNAIWLYVVRDKNDNIKSIEKNI